MLLHKSLSIVLDIKSVNVTIANRTIDFSNSKNIVTLSPPIYYLSTPVLLIPRNLQKMRIGFRLFSNVYIAVIFIHPYLSLISVPYSELENLKDKLLAALFKQQHLRTGGYL